MKNSQLLAMCVQVEDAYQAKLPLNIQGFGSKNINGYDFSGECLDTTGYSGVVQYDPTELVITAKAGTPISELEGILGEQNQVLAFEPPMIADKGSVGGMVATAWAGSSRPWRGGVRDFVLGMGVINGKGQHLRFGGQVMKNVAGYDVSRLMVGSMGSLSVLTDISLKVLPKPECQQFYRLELTPAELFSFAQKALAKMTPITGISHDGLNAHLRVEGREKSLQAFAKLYGLRLDSSVQSSLKEYWFQLRHHKHDFFKQSSDIWQLSLPKWSDVSHLNLPYLMDWAGARYWVHVNSEDALKKLKDTSKQLKGHLQSYRLLAHDGTSDRLQHSSASPIIIKLHQNLKAAYDPANILNPGRLFPGV